MVIAHRVANSVRDLQLSRGPLAARAHPFDFLRAVRRAASSRGSRRLVHRSQPCRARSLWTASDDAAFSCRPPHLTRTLAAISFFAQLALERLFNRLDALLQPVFVSHLNSLLR